MDMAPVSEHPDRENVFTVFPDLYAPGVESTVQRLCAVSLIFGDAQLWVGRCVECRGTAQLCKLSSVLAPRIPVAHQYSKECCVLYR